MGLCWALFSGVTPGYFSRDPSEAEGLSPGCFFWPNASSRAMRVISACSASSGDNGNSRPVSSGPSLGGLCPGSLMRQRVVGQQDTATHIDYPLAPSEKGHLSHTPRLVGGHTYLCNCKLSLTGRLSAMIHALRSAGSTCLKAQENNTVVRSCSLSRRQIARPFVIGA